jgi:hypothetical protein
MGELQPSYRIQGRDFSLPCVVRDASAGAACFLVPAAAARRLLPGPELELAELLPGRALLTLGIIDYRDNDLGDYDEVSIALFVHPRGEAPALPWLGSWLELLRGRLGVHIRHLPVNQSFTCEAGRLIWGFPKTVQQITFSYSPGRASCRLVYDGEHALSLSLARGGSRVLPEQELRTYSWIEGVAHVNRATQGAEGVGFRLGGAELELGRGALADELRGLGLPKRALFSTWMEHMHGRFGPPEKL